MYRLLLPGTTKYRHRHHYSCKPLPNHSATMEEFLFVVKLMMMMSMENKAGVAMIRPDFNSKTEKLGFQNTQSRRHNTIKFQVSVGSVSV